MTNNTNNLDDELKDFNPELIKAKMEIDLIRRQRADDDLCMDLLYSDGEEPIDIPGRRPLRPIEKRWLRNHPGVEEKVLEAARKAAEL